MNPRSLCTYCLAEDWWNTWAEDLYLAKEKALKAGRGFRCSSQSQIPRYIQLALIAEPRFVRHYNNMDKEEYLLAIVNMANDLWHDASVGILINLVVVKIVFLDMDVNEMGFKINGNTNEVLENFCKWQTSFNSKDWNHPNHYDLAILITRLGCLHDSETESGCKPETAGGHTTAMSPVINYGSTVWSNCSQEMISQVLGCEQESGEYRFGKVAGIYIKPEPEQEEIYIRGPLPEELRVYYALTDENSTGVECSHTVTMDKPIRTPRFSWQYLDWGPCSVRCGGGVQVVQPKCVEEIGGKVKDNYCNLEEKPEPKCRVCNRNPCRTHWKVWKWGECSGCLFRVGIRERQVACVEESPNFGSGDEVIVSPSMCQGPPPKKVELCNSIRRCQDVKKNRKQRYSRDLENLYLSYSRNLTGLERITRRTKSKSKSKKNWHHLRLCAKPLSTTLGCVVDVRNLSQVRLKVANLTECRGEPMGLSEENFQNLGDKVPIHIPALKKKEYFGAEAVAKLNEILHLPGKPHPSLKPRLTSS